ncbi:metal-sulfur cluster assembly factor [Effusibacillus lacus]|uniref:Fe-S assembly SUF system protein n=1 Tax=Effusibacillus lacus TaxID=1348429 RepID=A0A292YKR9_9BACL|nr:metal-sulfur cluster assembly factor [Effusibacillus lacus]TCS75509.1 metal-sulfur cluster biosynthetic enzyme [Effusibacillus lacus]GAX88974.1 Fe-S assembly SUF system protein [Effusibacillus lacus]
MTIQEEVQERLREVIDPELGINVVDLGLIYKVEVNGEDVEITMTLTTMGCPLHDQMARAVRFAAERVSGVKNVNVQVVWSPPWNPSMMSDAAKAALRR